ncbi:hypothetical protein Adt_05945 [Abeliophyllum distichum]|uniref:Uncharacterized protein n=1 Tax=Abeliophyllum distichum TaxID=126358 RepID=A0ABD1V5K8_9LAMI
MFPHFNIPISDPQLLSALKIQVQIIGAVPSTVTYAATLYYQMAYRVQNHSLDFATPQDTEDVLFLQLETDQPSCTYVPRQISRSELLKLIPETWVIGYEQHHQASQNCKPIQFSTNYFGRNSYGQVEIMFKKEPTQKRPPCFPNHFTFTTDNIPIYGF